MKYIKRCCPILEPSCHNVRLKHENRIIVRSLLSLFGIFYVKGTYIIALLTGYGLIRIAALLKLIKYLHGLHRDDVNLTVSNRCFLSLGFLLALASHNYGLEHAR